MRTMRILPSLSYLCPCQKRWSCYQNNISTGKKFFANNFCIMELTKLVEKLAHSYKIKTSKLVRKHLQAARHDLNERVLLSGLSTRRNRACKINNIGKTCKMVNALTNRKSSLTGNLRGKSTDKRKTQWFNHSNPLWAQQKIVHLSEK